MPAFDQGRRKNREPERARAMVYDGTNGPEITDWARDADLAARFQDRSQVIAGEVARILLPSDDPGQGNAWVEVPVGSTIHQDPTSRELVLEHPDDAQETEAK